MRRLWLILLAGAAWASTTTVSQFIPTPFDPAAGGASGTAAITISASCVNGGDAFVGGTVDVVSFSGGNFAVNLPPTDACPTQGSATGSAWSSVAHYSAGSRVQYSGQIYLALIGSTGVVPGTAAATWLDISPTYKIVWNINGTGWAEQWAVPSSSTPLTIDQVRLSQPAIASVPVPGPIGAGGTTNGTNGQALTSNGAGGFGAAVTLGTAATISATAGGDLSGTLPNPAVTSLAHVTNGSLPNSGLANAATTVNGQTCTLGSTCTVTVAASGTASGDLSGSYPSPTVAKINGASVPASAPVLGTNSSSQAIVASAHAMVGPLGCLDTSGSTTAQTCVTSPSFVPAYGDTILYTSHGNSPVGNGHVTLSVNGATPVPIFKYPNSYLSSGDLTGGIPQLLTFNSGAGVGDNWMMHYTPPVPTGTSIIKSNGFGGMLAAGLSDVTALTGTGSTAITNLGLPSSATVNGQLCTLGGSCSVTAPGYVVLTSGIGAPSANCSGPTTTNLEEYADGANGDLWFCYAANSWKKILSVTGAGTYSVTGATGAAPSAPASGFVSCYFDSTKNNQICLDTAGNAYTMVKDGADVNANAGTVVNGSHITNASIPNSGLVNAATTVNGQSCALGSSCTVTAAGGSTSWPAGLVYYGGNSGGAVVGAYGAQTPSVATTYCVDSYDPTTLTISKIVAKTGVTGNYYQAIAVLDSTGSVVLAATSLNVSGGETWRGFSASGTLAAGFHSWCTAIEGGTAPSWTGWPAQYAYDAYEWYPAGGNVGGVPINWYSCSTGPTGSGASFAIAAHGNCIGGGSKTAVTAFAPLRMAVYQ